VKAQLDRLAARFDALLLRERVMVFAGAAVVLVFIAYKLVIEPQMNDGRRLKQAIADQNMQLSAMQIQVKGLEQAKVMDLDTANRERLTRAQAQLSQLESELAAAQKGLVSAELMPSLLQDVLRQHHGLQLVELRTLPVVSLIERTAPKDEKTAKAPGDTAPPAAGATPPGGPERNLYKHGFEVTVKGSYPDFVQYLAQLEKLPMRMYWGKVTMNADDYPHVTLTATIFTLSLDKAWLAV
jgi:MSHA biogenesis protein MshJ